MAGNSGWGAGRAEHFCHPEGRPRRACTGNGFGRPEGACWDMHGDPSAAASPWLACALSAADRDPLPRRARWGTRPRAPGPGHPGAIHSDRSAPQGRAQPDSSGLRGSSGGLQPLGGRGMRPWRFAWRGRECARRDSPGGKGMRSWGFAWPGGECARGDSPGWEGNASVAIRPARREAGRNTGLADVHRSYRPHPERGESPPMV
jgi:hypothetical protein